MDAQYTFAKFWRCALQVNPVAYHSNYRGSDHGMSEQAYNQALLEKCLALDIKVVGVADHGNVDSIDALRAVLEQRGIVVFPGFEIAANDKTHFVCLFAESTSRQQLERYLGSLQLLDPEDGVCPSRLSSEQLLEMVDKLGGFSYAAHCTHDSGVLKLRQNHVWRQSQLRAAQIPGSIEDLAGVEDDFYRRVLQNRNPAYLRDRPMVAINAKDVARPEDLASDSASCWIKMTRPSFSAFKMAFLDPESRVRLHSQLLPGPIGRILHLRISGGYLDGVNLAFSDHLNTVIGGRGTGKSTLLECLRYALNILPKGKQAQKLHLDIIKENLGKAGGRVELDVMSSAQNGRRYRISRRYAEPPMVRDEHGNVSLLQPHDLLPGIDIYGQNEIYELAQDESGKIQLLDRFLPQDGEYVEHNNAIAKRLRENQEKLVKALGEIDEVKAQLARLPKLEEQLQGFQAMGVQQKLALTPLLARERQLVERADEELKRLREGMTGLQDSLPDLTFLSDKALDGLPDQAQLRLMREVLLQLQQEFAAQTTQLWAVLTRGEQQLIEQTELWRQSMLQHDAALEKSLRSLPAMAGKSGQEVGIAYQRLLQEVERIKPLKAKVSTLETWLAALQQERLNLLAALSDLRDTRLRNLQQAVKRLNKRLKGKLSIDVKPAADRTSLKQFLLDCKLEGVGEKRLAWIDELDSISPLGLSRAIREAPASLQAEWGCTPMVAEALMRLQPSQLMTLEAMALEHKVQIALNVNHGDAAPVFRPLDKLSTGQQCTAILHLLLLENTDPLVMDQPEDNLDNAFIADRIVSELRQAKTSRQFLFATHNANIPVFGDAEWIGVFTASDQQGHLGFEAQGSIDVPEIRDQVAKILEGGREAFIQRKEKYEF
jgi:ABC-type lipoprotein export system ATPase subunit